MAKKDYKKELKEFYGIKPGKIESVVVPKFNYLMIDGKGYPGSSEEYQDAMQTLYPISYTLKFNSKSKGKDYTVMPLEGLWWAEDMNAFTSLDMNRKEEWIWTSIIFQPSFITEEDVKNAIKIAIEKDKALPSIKKLRFEQFEEGLSAQLLHIGPYSEEGPNIQKLHNYIKDQGGNFDGHNQKHHEIYLSDPRRTKPDRLKTIIRQSYVLN